MTSHHLPGTARLLDRPGKLALLAHTLSASTMELPAVNVRMVARGEIMPALRSCNPYACPERQLKVKQAFRRRTGSADLHPCCKAFEGVVYRQVHLLVVDAASSSHGFG